MVSKIKYPKFPLLNFHSGKANTFFIFTLVIFLISFITGVFFNFESRILMGFTTVYILTGIFKQFFISESIKMDV